MCNFAAEKIPALCGKRFIIKKLYYMGVCQFDEFFNELKENEYKVYIKFFALISHYADGVRLVPKKQYRSIKGGKINAQLWEFKYKNHRIYYFDDQDGIIIVLGGTKKNQDGDIEIFKKTVKEYLKENI